MFDLKFIRENPAVFDKALKRRGMPPASGDILALDTDRRKLQTELQELQSRRNEISKQVGEAKRKGEGAEALMAEVTAIKEKASALEEQEKQAGAKLEELCATLPNMPFDDVPDGKDEKDNKEIRRFGEPPNAKGSKQHYEIGEALKLMDFDTAATLSGSRFTMLKGVLALLERALGNFMLDIHTQEFGYTEISPPLMVRDEIMFGTAQLPKFADDQFKTTTGLWLIPTAEVPLTNIAYDKIFDAADMPVRVTARTPCFRAEAGAAGKDTRGMLRQHQFYKVEMVSITTPDQSEEEHERMTECAETILKRLELPFRTMVLCSGDMGFASRKTYDIEVWLPGQDAYREISSCSNCGDFQARRMKARYRAKGEKSTQFLHTLNGSGVAIGRCLIAIMENYQQADGSIEIPKALQPYMNGLQKITG
ncbi:MAG: serine--tRNA ligase [Alphaproteobacteria bacterium]|nr:serine--tRNA ligase [Alphaproteobacteria bacterium]